MDSSGLQNSTSINSNRRCENGVSAMIQSKRAQFFATYLLQEFSLPDSVMFYLAKNSTSHVLYQKMIKTCKYFFIQNPVVASDFSYYNGEWRFSFEKCPINISKITSKIWITYRFYIQPGNSDNKKDINQNLISFVMPKLYKCDAEVIDINNQILSFHDLPLLISSAKRIDFAKVTVKNQNGTNVALEKIIEVAVKAKKIKISSDITQSNITSETMKELIKIPHFSTLNRFILIPIPETFDLKTFIDYLKKNKTTKIWLHFDDSVSEVNKNRLEKIVDEIIAAKNRGYKPPLIRFDGINFEKESKLADIYFFP